MGQWVSSNHNDADAYVGSALPFCSGNMTVSNSATTRIDFPYVTRWITVFNNTADGGNSLRVGFTENGINANPTSNSNFFVVPADTASPRLEVKCSKIFLLGVGGSATVSLIAGYTAIPRNQFLNLTASADFQGVG